MADSGAGPDEDRVVRMASLMTQACGALREWLARVAQHSLSIRDSAKQADVIQSFMELIKTVVLVRESISAEVDRPENISTADFRASTEYTQLVTSATSSGISDARALKLRENMAFALWDVGIRLTRVEVAISQAVETRSPELTAQLIRYARPVVNAKQQIGSLTLTEVSSDSFLQSVSSADVRIERSIHVKVAEAKELKAMDIGGTSDPYVVVRLDDAEMGRTPTVYKNLSPTWLEEYEFDVGPNVDEFVMEVFDWDRFGGDDRIGRVAIPISELRATPKVEKWFDLAPSSGDYHVEGDIGLKFLWAPTKTVMGGVVGSLSITVIDAARVKAADPNGLSDPYCTIRVGEGRKFKTKTIKKTLYPRWDETFEVQLNSMLLATRASLEMEFVVMDWDRVGSDDFLGRVLLKLSDVIANPTEPNTVQKRFRLRTVPLPATWKPLGKLRAAIHYVQQTVLPNEAYSPLSQLLSENNYALAIAIGEASGASGEMMTSMMRFFCSREMDIPFLRRALSDEISATTDSGTIFRGNSVASKSLDSYQKIVASNLLVRTLKPFIDEIFDAGKGKRDLMFFELDPTRVDTPSAVEKNAETMTQFATRLWIALQATKSTMPGALRVVYAIIRELVDQRFGNAEGVDVVRYTAPSGFLFLRFFCPAILGPASFSLSTIQAPSEAAARNCTLLSKTLMNLGNLVEFGQKEPFMHPMNAFIKRETSYMRDYLDAVCSFPPEVANNVGAQNAIARTFSELLAGDRSGARMTSLIAEMVASKKLETLPAEKRPTPSALLRLNQELARLQAAAAQKISTGI